ncbi:MAG: CHAT domain-containing protein [Terriglobales bacterium]
MRRAAEEAAAGSAIPDAELQRLPSSRPRAQRRLARRLQLLHRRSRPASRRRSRQWIYAAAAACALALLALAAWWLPFRGRAYLAERLVERAYTQHRTLPLRLEGAAYASLISPVRGREAPAPAALLEAEGLAAAGLDTRPGDPALLRIQARADLVQGGAAAAIADLQRALILQPRSPGLFTDLASAYFLSAGSGNDSAYGQALDYLGQALALQPQNSIARFNRALVEEALQDWTGAVADWSAYLARDPSGDWADEARRHLAADRRLVGQHDAAVAAPLLNPSQFARLTGVDTRTDARIEEYLHAATVAWLPGAYPVAGRPDPGAPAALRLLAAWLQRTHHDAWLEQVLAQAPRPPASRVSFARGLAAMAAAVQANDAGRPDAALAAARLAEADLDSAHAPAGAARAAYEEVYALFRREQGDACLAAVRRRLPPERIAAYGWLAGETALTQADCAGMAQASLAAQPLSRAVAVARADDYPTLRMRAEFMAVSYLAPLGSSSAWSRSRDLLALYWKERVGAYRAYALDGMLAIDSARRQQWFAAERLERASVERIALTPERSYEALARQQLASYAEICGFPAEAREERERAAGLFAQLPATPTTANLRAYNQLELAELAMEQGDTARAQEALEQYRREQPPVLSLEARTLPYFALRGELELERGDIAAAQLDERAAIAVSESDLRTLAQEEDRLGWQERNRDAYRAWVEIQWRLHPDPMAALEFWEWARATPVRSAQPAPASFLTAARAFDSSDAPPLPEPDFVRRQLPSMTRVQVISYALYPRELAMWLYDNRGVHALRLPISSLRLEAAAHAFAAACADPGSDPQLLATQARQLYAWLLAPVAAWLDPQRVLMVETDGALAEVPFAALQTSSGAYLAQAVVQSPGLMYARLAHTDAGSVTPLGAQRFLGVADPAVGTAPDGTVYPPLPEARAEVAAAAADFSPASRVLAGAAATPAAVLAAFPGADVFHFAGHASSGRLLLASGAELQPAALTPMLLRHCRLAVLAACSTAASPPDPSEPQALVRAFLRAGVARVVATRWPVDSPTTSLLCRAFYAALARGDCAAAALRQAQLQVRRDTATQAPFYWAGFAAFGALPDPNPRP